MFGEFTASFNAGKLGRLGRTADENSENDVVLVVEDSKAVRDLLCTYLDRLGSIDVDAVPSMAEARRLLGNGSRRYFCAVLDLTLPDAPDGEIVELVRDYEIPVIVVTGRLDEQIRQNILSKNVVDYINKSCHSEIEHVAYLIGRLRENREVKILIVDDSQSARLYVDSLLRNYQYQTLQASNGEEALAVLERHPDTTLVITDINMPKMDGMELIREIRKKYRREELAVIGLSNSSSTGTSAMLIKIGANDYLSKPFEIEELYCRVTQNTNMIRYVRQVQDHATRDFLTGVHNRRHFFDVGGTLYASARRGHIRLAAAVIDADHFKHINDRYGHAAGDEVLKAIAQTLEAGLRKTDIIARYGGEEFVCLAVLKEREEAALLFERLRSMIASLRVEADGATISVTVSIGVTTDPSRSLEEMLKIADEGVYQAKEAGRNRVACQP